MAEAELLEVVDKVVSEFRGAKGAAMVEYEFHISHETVLAAILAAVPERLRSDVLRFFKDVGVGLGYTEARTKLQSIAGLSKQLQDELEQCCLVGALVRRGALQLLTDRRRVRGSQVPS